MYRPRKPIINPEMLEALRHLNESLQARRTQERLTEQSVKQDPIVRRGAQGNDLLHHKKLGKDF